MLFGTTTVAVPNPVGPAELVPVTTIRYTRPLPLSNRSARRRSVPRAMFAASASRLHSWRS